MVTDMDPNTRRVSLSTKNLESTPGDMLNNRLGVFRETEAKAAKFRTEIAAWELVSYASFDICSIFLDVAVTYGDLLRVFHVRGDIASSKACNSGADSGAVGCD